MHWVILALLLAQLSILAWNAFYWRSRRAPVNEPNARISILIPARNERHNLPHLLSALAGQSFATFEILVCDDHSDDETAKWLADNAERLGVQWFPADPRPDGWMGKNWACHLLARRATGEWLLFLDADLRPKPEFMDWIARRLGDDAPALVSGFPRPRPASTAAGLLEAMVPFSVLTTLPIQPAEQNRHPALAFAHGQMIAMRRRDYERLQPHERKRAKVLEDVEVARLVKREGGRLQILDASGVVDVSMYAGLRDAIDGFSKNAVPICGGSIHSAALIAVVLAATYLLPIALLPFRPVWMGLAVILAALNFGGSSGMIRLPRLYGLLYPVAMVLAEITIIRSIGWHARGVLKWKGRTYRIR